MIQKKKYELHIDKFGYKYVIRVQSNFSKIITNAIAADSQVTALYHKTPVNFRVLDVPLCRQAQSKK